MSMPTPAPMPAPAPVPASPSPVAGRPTSRDAASPAAAPGAELGLAPLEEDEPETAAAKREDLKAKIAASESPAETETIETEPEPQEQPDFSDKFDQFAEPAAQPVAFPPDEEVFSHGVTGAVVLGAGALGMIGGLILGVVQSPGDVVMGAYVGAAIGWVGGFMVAFLFAFSGQRDSGKVRCQACGNLFPADTQTCGWCGAPIEQQALSPLAVDCLGAFSYARRGAWSVAWATIIAVAASLIWLGCQYVADSSPGTGYVWVVAALGGLIGLAMTGYMLEFFSGAIDLTVREPDKPPSFGAFGPRSLLMATRAVGVVVVYVLPVLTLPLLPAGLMLMDSHGLSDAMGLRRAVDIVRRRPHDYAILWLMVLLWAGAMALAITLAALGNSFLFDLLPADPQAAQVVEGLDFCLVTGVVSAIAAAFGLAIFRCIGSFARHHRG